MKPTTLEGIGSHGEAIYRGWVAPSGPDADLEFPSLDMQNDSGEDLLEGQAVVVLADGTIAKTTTVSDPRPTGVCVDDIADGESGPVAFIGPVDTILTTASVTAGNWGRTSATLGAVEETTDPDGAFVYFTTSGTEPEGFLWPRSTTGGGGGGGTGLTEDDADELYLKRKAGEDHLVYISAGTGATETLNLTAYNTFDLTLDDDCTLSFAGPLDAGVHLQWTLILRQDGTGSRTVTWPGSVQWQDTDGTSGGSAPTLFTAPGAENVVILTTLDGGTTFGAGLEGAGSSGGVSASDAFVWRPLIDTGTGTVIFDSGTGNAVMAFGAI